MKQTGSVSDFKEERLRDLMRVYDRYVAEMPVVVMSELFEWIVDQPAQRFYVSHPRACDVVGRMTRGLSIGEMRPLKREMFEEIYRRTMALRCVNEGMSIAEAVDRVLHEPAPKFYLSPFTAKVYLYPMRRIWYETKMRRVQFWQSPL